MSEVKDQVATLMSLFEGYTGAYGTYNAASAAARELGGKVEIKSTVVTKREPVTLDLWRDHVDGLSPLGIMPIRQDNTCLWGCIDIDVYDVDVSEIWEIINREKLPLLPCRTKSGGLHLFMFVTEPVAAAVVQARLREMAVLLGYGTSEVFPKQTQVFWNKGDMGSWLNMPYFRGEKTDRYGLKPNGLAMTLSEFIAAAESVSCTAQHVCDTQYRKVNKKSSSSGKGEPDFADGPPCMQHMATAGFPEGTRNIGLFNLGTFAKKKYGARWVSVLEQWNRDLMAPPLDAGEVSEVLKQQRKKDYQYQCKEHPLSTHCNGSLCRTRKFGVGNEDDLPTISGMSVLKTVPPLWFVDVGDQRMEMTTEQLQSYPLFHRACMEQLHICYRGMRQDTWLMLVGAAMRDAVEIEVSPEAGLPGQFYELLEDFLLNKHSGETVQDLLLGRPFQQPDESGEVHHYFRLRDLRKALDLANFRNSSNGFIIARLRAVGCTQKFFNIKNKNGVSTWAIPASKFAEIEQLDLPPLENAPI